MRTFRPPTLAALLLVFVALLATAPARSGAMAVTAPAADARVALVIGNASYRGAPLANPVNDARAVAERLRALGFAVIERENLTQRQIGATLHEFRTRLTPGTVALFFYAGHGLQVNGSNFLPAVDAEIGSEEEVRPQSLDVNDILALMDQAHTRLNLLFLDACRNNPFSRSFRSLGEGLAKVNAPSGTIISFATRPGSVAADSGSGRNGLYTEHLLRAMELTDQPIEQALKQVVGGVKRASAGRQEPWMEGSIEGDFCFGACRAGNPLALADLPRPASAAPARSAEQIEDELWDGIKDSRDAADFDAYLQGYPAGRYAAIARLKKRALANPAPAGQNLFTGGASAPERRPNGPPLYADPAPAAVQPGRADPAALVAVGNTDRDPSSLAALLASQLTDGLARGGIGGGSATRVTVSFYEDINKRSDRIFGAWRLEVPGAPGCAVQISDRWFGRGGFAGIGQAKDEAVATAYGTLLRYLKERVYIGDRPSC